VTASAHVAQGGCAIVVGEVRISAVAEEYLRGRLEVVISVPYTPS